MLTNEISSEMQYKEFLKLIVDELKKTSDLNHNVDKEILFNDMIDAWLNEKSITTKETTYAYYRFVVDSYIRESFKDIPVHLITKEMVNEFIIKKMNSNLSDSFIKQILKILRQIFKYSKIDIEIAMPKVIKKEVEILSHNEVKELEEYLSKNMDNENLCVSLSLFLGLRIGEVCALKWSNFDLINKTLKIDKTIERIKNYTGDTETKTTLKELPAKTGNSIRVVPLSDQLIEIIKNLSKGKNKETYILTSNTKYMDPRTYYNHYQTKLSMFGIDKNYHCLRHTFATNCIDKGLNVKAVSQILGHSNVQTTLSIYVHPNLNKTRDFLNNNFTY